MEKRKLTLGHSPDPDDAFMFYGLAKGLIDDGGYDFEHILQDIQTLNERASRGELDISAISIHAYAHVCGEYALLPSGASMGDGYGPMLVAREKFSRQEIASLRIAVPGTMTSAFLALQLWLERPGERIDYTVVPFDEIFKTVNEGRADVGLIIHEGQLTFENEGLVCCEDFGVWWGRENDGLPLPLGGAYDYRARRQCHPQTHPGGGAKSDLRRARAQHPVQPRAPRRGGGALAAIRPRHGHRLGGQVRRHVRERLDA